MKNNPKIFILIILLAISVLNLSAQEFWITTGNQEELCPPTLMDADMNTYNTILIGDQCWMAENLSVGSIINSNYEQQSNNGVIEKFCYDNNEQYCVEYYGGLYQWEEAMDYDFVEPAQGICPDGWHIPSDAEWTVLTDYLGGVLTAGGKMKTIPTTETGGLWLPPNTGATNESEFSGLPGGQSQVIEGGASVPVGNSFMYQNSAGFFWSSTISPTPSLIRSRVLSYDSEGVTRMSFLETKGFSVRCLKDLSAE